MGFEPFTHGYSSSFVTLWEPLSMPSYARSINPLPYV
jgi:hypothetical protein